MSGRLTTHVLDTSAGHPAAGVPVELWALEPDGARRKLAATVTDEDGRAMLLDGGLEARAYELLFDLGAYFGPGFLTQVPVRFTVQDAALHHHVPLLATPWSYSTYRGS